DRVESVDTLSFRFSASHLSQYAKSKKSPNLTDDILNFRHGSSFSKTLSLCSRSRMVIEALLNNSYTDSMECMVGEKEEGFACKFLANEADREKIVRAREILLQHIGEPITIKDLSRKVAINECYLKKGFKEMFGATVFDFYQG